MRWKALFLFLCGACIGLPETETLSSQVKDATLAGWLAAGLPEPPSGCYLERFRVLQPTTSEEFSSLCESVDGEVCSRMLWRAPEHGPRWWYPVAVVHPSVENNVVATQATHGLLHLLVACTLPLSEDPGSDVPSSQQTSDDPYDLQHVDLRVWLVSGGARSAEQLVRDLLIAREPAR